MRKIHAVAAFCLSSLTCQATTVLDLDRSELVRRADHIIEGRVHRTTCSRDARGVITTFVTIDIDPGGVLKGTANQKRITLRLPGGTLPSENLGLMIPGMPSFQTGEQALVFFTEPHGAGPHLPVGLGLGKFRVVRDRRGRKMLERSLEGLELVDPRTGAKREHKHGPERFDYAEWRQAIQAQVKARKRTR